MFKVIANAVFIISVAGAGFVAGSVFGGSDFPEAINWIVQPPIRDVASHGSPHSELADYFG